MLPPRCIQPPCRNIDVNSVVQNGSGIVGGEVGRRRVLARHDAPGLDEGLEGALRRAG